jgi:hypothetical protein
MKNKLSSLAIRVAGYKKKIEARDAIAGFDQSGNSCPGGKFI